MLRRGHRGERTCMRHGAYACEPPAIRCTLTCEAAQGCGSVHLLHLLSLSCSRWHEQGAAWQRPRLHAQCSESGEQGRAQSKARLALSTRSRALHRPRGRLGSCRVQWEGHQQISSGAAAHWPIQMCPQQPAKPPKSSSLADLNAPEQSMKGEGSPGRRLVAGEGVSRRRGRGPCAGRPAAAQQLERAGAVALMLERVSTGSGM